MAHYGEAYWQRFTYDELPGHRVDLPEVTWGILLTAEGTSRGVRNRGQGEVSQTGTGWALSKP